MISAFPASKCHKITSTSSMNQKGVIVVTFGRNKWIAIDTLENWNWYIRASVIASNRFGTTAVYFFCIPHKKITDQFTIIRIIRKFLLSGLISSMRSDEKLGHTNLNPEIIYLYIIDSIYNDWKHILRYHWKQHTSLRRNKPMNYELFLWYGWPTKSV